ncbi:MAG: sugar phosphate isomerase/epimerase family protein [Anaerolineae bacterium]|nr:sugar phosphate isomerase/epimerase [Thermoflexales bacterium]MDW8406785.1 sugar phosphate isomerase/epimerase family protein [Anaerolineae bacterium]
MSTREQIEVIAQAGFDFCELPAKAVQPFEEDAAALPALRSLGTAPLRPEAFNVLVPPQLPLVGAKRDVTALRTYLRRAFRRMVQLGASVAVFGSGGARRLPEDMPRQAALDQLAESISVIADEADRVGLQIALEPLNRNECNVLNTLSEAQAFIDVYDLAGARLLVDLFHLQMEQEPLAHVTVAAPLLAHVHVAGGGRRAPHIPGCDYAGFMAALHEAGYDARISAECAWEDLSLQAGDAVAFMRSFDVHSTTDSLPVE